MSASKPSQLATEIQLEILEHLAEDGRRQVAEFPYNEAWRRYARLMLPFILVNKAWFDRGTDLLWREPFTPALAAINPESRRQFYAKKVQSLGLYLFRSDHVDCPATFANMRFPRLRRLEVNNCPTWMRMDIAPYLSSTITSFTLLGCDVLARTSLDLVAFCCPKLQDIYLHYAFEGSTDRYFLKFLEKCKCLRDITLSSNGDNIPVDVLANILGRRHLELFDARDKPVSYDSVVAIMQGHPRLRPFRNLRTLCMNLETRAVPLVLSAAEMLVDLQLNLEDSESDIFGPIGCLLKLENLDLCFLEPKRLLMSELLAITSLRRLQELVINRPSGADLLVVGYLPGTMPFDDENFHKWISSYPEMRKMQLGVRPLYDYWLSETRIIAECCPKLRELIMEGVHDIGPWKVSPPPLFPNLARLQLGGLRPWPFFERYVSSLQSNPV